MYVRTHARTHAHTLTLCLFARAFVRACAYSCLRVYVCISHMCIVVCIYECECMLTYSHVSCTLNKCSHARTHVHTHTHAHTHTHTHTHAHTHARARRSIIMPSQLIHFNHFYIIMINVYKCFLKTVRNSRITIHGRGSLSY